jgi:hypothetical protein
MSLARKKTGSEAPAPDRGQALKQLLLERLQQSRTTSGLVALANELGVSTRTFSAILKGRYDATEDGTRGGEDDATAPSYQKIRGFAQSLTRVALALELTRSHEELVDLAQAFGLPKSPYLDSAIRGEEKETAIPPEVDDQITREIRRRGTAGAQLRLGVLEWEPYVSVDDEDIGHSLAALFLRDVMMSVFPQAEVEQIERLRGLDDLIESVVLQPRRVDAAFALFEVPARYGAGVLFVPVEGLVGHLGALVPREEGPAISWLDIMGNITRRRPPAAMVLRDEIGHQFLGGICGYRETAKRPQEGSFTVTDHDSVDRMAEALLDHRARTRARNVDAAFVAEWGICERVLRARGVAEEFESLRYDPDRTPRYRTGIAVRADASLLAMRIQRALDLDAYGTALFRTAAWYVRVFHRAGEIEKELSHTTPPRPAPAHGAAPGEPYPPVFRVDDVRAERRNRFVRALQTVAQEMGLSGSLSKEIREYFQTSRSPNPDRPRP